LIDWVDRVSLKRDLGWKRGEGESFLTSPSPPSLAPIVLSYFKPGHLAQEADYCRVTNG
jgi:hypothetical protein